MSNSFDAAVATVLRHEGGFQNSHDDRGNWTGGATGQGELKGTKFGISAAAYPALDIAALTQEQATSIYFNDWWLRYGFDRLPAPIGGKLLDAAVADGENPVVHCLQRALRACGYRAIADDGQLGHDTIGAAIGAGAALLPPLREAVAEHFRLVAQARAVDAEFLAGWLKRAYDEV